MEAVIIQNLVRSLETILFVMAAGYLMECADRLLIWALAAAMGRRSAALFVNYLTFPGVILHECSHALLAVLTGARVTHIRFFAPDGNSLGSVTMSPRGNFLTKSLQYGMSAIAPAFCSLLWLYLLRRFLYPAAQTQIWVMVLFVYLCVSILLHASLSGADIKAGLKGLPGCFLVIFLILVLGRIDPGQLCLKYFRWNPYDLPGLKDLAALVYFVSGMWKA